MLTKTEQLKQAIADWQRCADSELDLAAHYEKIGTYGDTSGFHYRAEVYQRTVESLQLELETGVPHCNCHMIPSEDCPWRIKTGVLL